MIAYRMQDFDRLIVRFRQFGGMRLVWQYAKMGVLWIGVKEIIKCMVHGRSFKTVYPVLTKRVDEMLLEFKGARVQKFKSSRVQGFLRSSRCSGEQTRSKGARVQGFRGDDEATLNCGAMEPWNRPSGNSIWFCWLQGMDNAPELVKICLESIRSTMGDVIVIDDKNYTEYVELPEYVTRKYKKGIIPPALFSDMLRLELLIQYGGTWIDSTVWASPEIGVEDSKCQKAWQTIQESELFIYRYFNREGRVEGISNWFIHAKAGNALLKDVRDMLYAYWREYNCTVEYYIFHLFFSNVAKRYPEMIKRMPRGNSYHALWLAHHADRGITDENWQKLIANVPFHKLNWRKRIPFMLNGNGNLFFIEN